MKLVVFCRRLKALIVAVEDKVLLAPLEASELKEIAQFEAAQSAGSAVQCLALDEQEEFLFAAFENKAIVSWRIDSREVVGSRTMRKKPTAIACGALSLAETATDTETEKKQVLLVSDKAGDIYAVRVPALQRESLVAGHTASVVTDLVLSTDRQRVVTADRDEKLRVSSFPDLETIKGYLLAHTNVVASVDCLQSESAQQLALSSGWDHQLALWDLQTCSLLHALSLKSEATKSAEKEESAEGATAEETAGEEKAADAENDMIPEKEYNEKDAGNYPFKVVGNGKTTAAVLFKSEQILSVYAVRDTALALLGSVALPAAPLDAVFIDADSLAVLLPTPHMVQVYSLSSLSEGQESVRQESAVSETVVSALKDLASANFDQSVVSKGLGWEAESGMKKHLLDRPFNEEEHINFNAKKGSKRSRKN